MNSIFPKRLSDGFTYKSTILTTSSPEFTCGNLNVLVAAAAGSTAWTTANKPLAIPFRISVPMVVQQFGWRNGSGTQTDSVDIGIYDSAFNRLVSGGGTARSGGASTTQWVNVTDTALPVGAYYLATSMNGTTAGQYVAHPAMDVGRMAWLGGFDSGTDSYPLADPLASMVACATFTRIPVMMIACKVPF